MDNVFEKSSAQYSAEMDYVCIQALSDGVSIIGMTRGKDTRLHHTEKLDAGELCIMQFTEYTSAIKIRGHAQVYTKYGPVTVNT